MGTSDDKERQAYTTLVDRLDTTRDALRTIAGGEQATIGTLGTDKVFGLLCALYMRDLHALKISDHAGYRERSTEYAGIRAAYDKTENKTDKRTRPPAMPASLPGLPLEERVYA